MDHAAKEDEDGPRERISASVSIVIRLISTHSIAPPLPPDPLQPIVSIEFGVAASKKPSSAMGVGFPNVFRRFPAAGLLGVK